MTKICGFFYTHAIGSLGLYSTNITGLYSTNISVDGLERFQVRLGFDQLTDFVDFAISVGEIGESETDIFKPN